MRATRLSPIDRLVGSLDRGIRTVFAPAQSRRPEPGAELPEAELDPAARAHAARLLRVNHTGEVCAQALYQGQMLVARNAAVREVLADAADEETDHLAWTQARLTALGGRRSHLDPIFYAGSFLLGALSGIAGDRRNLGFLAETERQVEQHLQGHLQQLPPDDARSRAVLSQMRDDEAAHARTAVRHGGTTLPKPVRSAMRAASRIMTRTTYWI